KDAAVNIPNNTGQIHFASVNVASNVGKNIVIENLGNANLNFNSLQINGAHAGMFTTVFTSANPILPANAVSFDLKYQPSSIGFHTAFITVNSNDLLKNPYTFAVYGHGNPNPDIFVTVYFCNGK
ncbi:MAG: choice-of-anchor D domain-containing protein, partial [Bacteroidetes bacterium]